LTKQVYYKNYRYNISKTLLCFISSTFLNQWFQIKVVFSIQPMNAIVNLHFLHPLHYLYKDHLFKHYLPDHQLILRHLKDLLILTLLLPFLNHLHHHKNQNHLRLLSPEAFQTTNTFVHHWHLDNLQSFCTHHV